MMALASHLDLFTTFEGNQKNFAPPSTAAKKGFRRPDIDLNISAHSSNLATQTASVIYNRCFSLQPTRKSWN